MGPVMLLLLFLLLLLLSGEGEIAAELLSKRRSRVAKQRAMEAELNELAHNNARPAQKFPSLELQRSVVSL